ncbi:hypothetical protein GALMADRAFT_233731 [Galerina marginata CBS 339.88]|uniref:Ribosome biogenesis protein SLX9 n=1 Tax=Galerina marginata (strain CBS 339.88) TaxID=685588 RepID=A0A067TPG7_GALM3|nr:hypothetical protein GALMADRAFT_233731 [Galerina marginata CBS 339.88]
MPKVARVRHGKHHSSAKSPQVSDLNVDDDPQSSSLPNLQSPSASHGELGPATSFESRLQSSKKAKQLEKREAFLQKLEPSIRQMSKSHQRRLKRKAKEQLTGGLEDLQSALVSLEKETIGDEAMSTIAAVSESRDEAKPKSQIKSGTIGKGGPSTLSKAQRKRVLEVERLRHPHILTNSEFSSNPFQTIRTHAQNTLLSQVARK